MRISPSLQSIDQHIVIWVLVMGSGVVVVIAVNLPLHFPLAAGRGGRKAALAPDPPVSPPIA